MNELPLTLMSGPPGLAELAALLSAWGDAAAARVELLTALHLCLVALLLFCCLREWARGSRSYLVAFWAGSGLWMVLALLIRSLWIPAWTGHFFDGHEADYFDVWRGLRQGLEQGYRVSEGLRTVYRWLGPRFGGGETALLGLTLAVSLLAIPGFLALTRMLAGSGPRAAQATALATLLLVLDPVHAFWSSSAYNIMQPFVLSVAALWLLERGLERGRATELAAGMSVWATAVLFREEALLLAPVVLVRGALHLRNLRQRPLLLGWMALMLPLLLWPVLPNLRGLTEAGADGYAREMFSSQWSLWIYLEPYFSGPGGISVGFALLGLMRFKRWDVLATAAAAVLPHHLAYAGFDDAGTRHTLLPRAMMALAVGIGLLSWLDLPNRVSSAAHGDERRWLRRMSAGIAAAMLCLELLFGLQDVSRRYYASDEDFLINEPRFATTTQVEHEELEGCVWVAESGRYADRTPSSHFEMLTRQGFDLLRDRGGGCVLFVYDLENYQASSRSIHDRARKLQAMYTMSLLGRDVDPSGQQGALIFRVESRR